MLIAPGIEVLLADILVARAAAIGIQDTRHLQDRVSKHLGLDPAGRETPQQAVAAVPGQRSGT
mgnify:CR=1 FL=1